MFTPVEVLTEVVLIVNVVVVAPLAIVTLPGTVAAGLLLDNVITAPPDCAAPFNVTVPVELAPPTTNVGLTVTEETCKGSTPSAAETVPL